MSVPVDTLNAAPERSIVEEREFIPVANGEIKESGRPDRLGLRRLITYVRTVNDLGFANVGRVVAHRVFKRTAIYRLLLPCSTAIALEFDTSSGTIFALQAAPWANSSVAIEADELLSGRIMYFSAHRYEVGNPPNWFMAAIQKKQKPRTRDHWSEIADFRPDLGDIKVFWEASRFTWAPVFARAWRATGNRHYLSALQLWMQDWCSNNPPNTGPNWMCGQEASVRLINALLALRVSGLESSAGPGMVSFVEAHCRRIGTTCFYAVAQDNNHATSEAAALFIGGSWLANCSTSQVRAVGVRWARRGRKLLERAVARLILPDGSFSQHSLTYHRMMLDTLSQVELWRKYTEQLRFTEDFYGRAAAATRWLAAMVDVASGDGPNVGTNDGTYPFRLSASPYRDFRPCLQLASMLFTAGPALSSGPWDEAAAWLGMGVQVKSQERAEPASAVFPDGGYVVLRNSKGVMVMVRTPKGNFRPPHADALHIDLWSRGHNLLKDGGTYTYGDDDVA